MKAIVSSHRVLIPGGLWTNKVGGEIKEGDPAVIQFTLEGRGDIKELRGHMKLFFQNIKMTQKPIILSHADKDRITKQYRTAKKMDEIDLDELSEEEQAKLHEKEKTDLEAIFKAEVDKVLTPPKLYVFLTKKRPKSRMTEVHKTAVRVYLPGNNDGKFGTDSCCGNLEVPLKDMVDILSFQGIVFVKLPQDEPRTEDSVVYGFISLISARSQRIRTKVALHLNDVADILSKLSTFLDVSKERKPSECLKSLSHYRTLTNKAWQALRLEVDSPVDFEMAKKLAEYCEVFLVDTQLYRLLEVVDVGGDRSLGPLEFENFLMANDILGPAPADINIIDIYDSLKCVPDEKFGEFSRKEGMDYSGFCEAVQMMGVKGAQFTDLQKAFCHGASITAKHIQDTYLTQLQFKKAWLQVANVENELGNRKMKYEKGAMSENRNRERLIRALNEQEEAYFGTLKKVLEVVERVKADRRRKKDEKRREFESFREKLQHDADKLQALRGQEKRLQLKKEQEEKSKKRLEEKILRNKLLLRQSEAKAAKDAEIQANMAEAVRLRQDEVRARGLDRLDLSVQALREVPAEKYHNEIAQRNLSYVIICDLSRNKIEHLPSTFLYWMTEARKLKLSDNHLYDIPNELRQMISLEVLELNTNRLSALPEDFGALTALQRLDISNNQINFLPESIGMCGSIRYFNAHSNNLTILPTSLASCFRLEYLDISRNQLRELPEDVEHLISLFHIDVSSNRIGHLPKALGKCEKLAYLDASTNILAFLPDTFSKLVNLEFLNLTNNDIIITPDKFNNLTKLKTLNLRRNAIKTMFSDMKGLRSLLNLDLSLNLLTVLPQDIGLIRNLQDLDLSYNRLPVMPVELGSCLLLQKLNLRSNDISGWLPSSLGNMKSLRTLDISNNPVTNFPDSVLTLKDLHTIQADHCQISELPYTFTYLDGLEFLDLNNNEFSRFPIELKDMKSLKTLALADNKLALLPRNICTMSNLETLDLSKNQLRALPVEFVDVLESVPRVNLSNNPWSDWPLKWGKLWDSQKIVDGSSGYNVADAVSFLYGMRTFYDVAEAIWTEKGALHYTNRLGLHDFVEDLRSRIPHTFYDGLMEHIKTLYFQMKESGNFPKWYTLLDEDINEQEKRKAVDSVRREFNVVKSKQDLLFRYSKTEAAYDTDIYRKARTMGALAEEQRISNQVLEHISHISMRECLSDRQLQADKRKKRREREWQEVVDHETARLNELIH